ncbi:hypothetical protein [Litorimonas haliclonae]
MSDSSKKKSADKTMSREERLAKTLRDNLRRRKQAARKKAAPNDKTKSGS